MRLHRMATVFAALMFVLVYASALYSDAWDQTTKVTFTEAVEVPGTVLQPGTYVFKLANSDSDRHIVEIYNEDHTKLITTVLALSNERLQLSGKTVLTYNEHASGQPAALKAWFYPGDNIGQQFVYPRSEALMLTRLNNEEVPSTGSEEAYPGRSQAPANAQNITPPESQPVENQQAQASSTPAPSVQTSTAKNNAVQANPAASTPPAAAAPPASPAPGPEVAQNQLARQAQLPQTASWEPLIGLIGFGFILAAILLRRLQKA